MNEMNIASAKYVADDTGNIAIIATIDGSEWGVPISEGNRHYTEIMRQVEAGTLTIQDAD
tara:strand:- start:5806 stop:5985 length:180 start_codon:yes stop_codon:yes gene_type:complete